MAAAAAAMGVVLASALPASACLTYCDWDPVVAVVTPGGHLALVYDSVWTSSPLELGLPLESYTTTRVYDSAGRPQTAVDMTIYVPAGLLFRFPTHDVVTTGLLGSGQVLASAYGSSGAPVHLKFTLPEA
ncbi:MAG TPA: hypothetical protein VGG31_08785 [Candidatus Dormibacteraeota bacterium]|jgi:hypothetical protein